MSVMERLLMCGYTADMARDICNQYEDDAAGLLSLARIVELFHYTTLISSIFTPRSRKMMACRTSSSAVLLQGFGVEIVKQSGVWSNHAAATAPCCLHIAPAVVAETAGAFLLLHTKEFAKFSLPPRFGRGNPSCF